MNRSASPELRSFADIPSEIERRVDAGEKVLLILLDAFGLEFIQRHTDHPLVARLDVTPLRTQFPSTTTAHIPTLAFGMPVEQHGWYEWNVYEPALDQVFCPFRWALSDGYEFETHTEILPPAGDVLPGPTFARRLGGPAAIFQSTAYSGSVFTRICADGAEIFGFQQLGGGVDAALRWFQKLDRGQGAYAHLYWDEIDSVGHTDGPSSEAFRAASLRALDAIDAALADTGEDVTVLFTADHGQVDVSADRVDYLDTLWPQLTDQLRLSHPAGSARDVFLHLNADSDLRAVVDELSARVPEGTVVKPARELFTNIGPRLEARLGDVAVLPAPGREIWLSNVAGPHTVFKGHHGGLTEAEATTYLAQLRR